MLITMWREACQAGRSSKRDYPEERCASQTEERADRESAKRFNRPERRGPAHVVRDQCEQTDDRQRRIAQGRPTEKHLSQRQWTAFQAPQHNWQRPADRDKKTHDPGAEPEPNCGAEGVEARSAAIKRATTPLHEREDREPDGCRREWLNDEPDYQSSLVRP